MNKHLWNELKLLAKKTMQIDKSTMNIKINQSDVDKIHSPNSINANQMRHGIHLLKSKIKAIINNHQKAVKEVQKPRLRFLDFAKSPVKMKTMYAKEAEKDKLNNRKSKNSRISLFSSSPSRRSQMKWLSKLTNSIEKLPDFEKVKSQERIIIQPSLKTTRKSFENFNKVQERILRRVKSTIITAQIQKRFKNSIQRLSKSPEAKHNLSTNASSRPVTIKSTPIPKFSFDKLNAINRIHNTYSSPIFSSTKHPADRVDEKRKSTVTVSHLESNDQP